VITPDPTPPRTIDAAERAYLIKVLTLFSGPCFIILSMMWFFLSKQGVVSPGVARVLVLLSLPLAVFGAYGIRALVGRGSSGLMDTIYSWGSSVPVPPSYPRQDALIARGQYGEAAEYFRDHIRVSPEDLEARLRLADLVEHHLKGDGEAEQLYLEVRRLGTTPHHHAAATNGLIDLYRRTGRKDRLRVELARFAEKYRGSAAGRAAEAELRELKAATTRAETDPPSRS
jgi:hypothetical protein